MRVLTSGGRTRASPTADYEAMLSECESSLHSRGAACILHDFHHVTVHTLRQLVYAAIGKYCLEYVCDSSRGNVLSIYSVLNCCDDRVGGNGF